MPILIGRREFITLLGGAASICRYGGRLWVAANEPRGAVFQFILPSAEKEFTTVLLVEASK